MPTTATNEKEKNVNNDINTINQSLGSNILQGLNNIDTYNTYNTYNIYNTIQSAKSISDGITFFDRNAGALICNDVGNKEYDAIFKEALSEMNKKIGDKFDDVEKQTLNDIITQKLNNYTSCELNGYKLVEFMSGEFNEENILTSTGFQGGIYYNETTGDYVVVCRGTEFKSGNEEFYKDFVQTDVLEFGKDIVPSAFDATEELLLKAIDMANKDHSKVHIVGHSLGGGIAQLLGSLEDYKDIDVTTYNPVGVEHLLNEEGIKNRVQTGADKFSNIINYATCNDFVSTIFKCVGKMEMIKCVGLPEMTLYMAARATMTSEAAKGMTHTYSTLVTGMMLLKKLIKQLHLLKG